MNASTIASPARLDVSNELPELRFRRFATDRYQEWNGLKEQVTAQLTAAFATELSDDAVRRSVNEADSLAALTPFPALFLPALAEEKARATVAWQAKQRRILSRAQAFAE